MDPFFVGAKPTVTVQDCPGATDDPQLLVSVKTEGAVVMPWTVSGWLVALARVTGAVAVVFVVTLPKFTNTGNTRIPVTVPVPERETVCGEVVALSVMVSVAVSVVGCVGLKLT